MFVINFLHFVLHSIMLFFLKKCQQYPLHFFVIESLLTSSNSLIHTGVFV